jgi:NodT family efflux transporter outer membrane factor (OMF) lipoprotein
MPTKGRLSDEAFPPEALDMRPRCPTTNGTDGHHSVGAILTWIGIGVLALAFSGCTGFHEYVNNGYKVGPKYCRPAADVADRWIDYQDPGIQSDARTDDAWWSLFNDPVLTQLIVKARHQNVSLREACWRIQEAEAQRCIAVGNLFPQKQQAVGSYTRYEESQNFRTLPENSRFFSGWEYGGVLAWELDFWGLYRRAVEAADGRLDASVEDYRNVLVLLQAAVAQSYVEIRAADQELFYLHRNLELQSGTLSIVSKRFQDGATTQVDVLLATAHVAETQALIPPVEIRRRKASDRLCHLLGIPAQDIADLLGGSRPIPTAPPKVAVGIPAELLSERPDVRAAERQVAAQSAEVGVATAKLYPHISITGFIGYRAESFPELFDASSAAGQVGPTIQWDVLNYGRLVNGIRVQNARLQERAYHYQDVVLNAGQEVEDALIAFLKSQVEVLWLTKSTTALSKAAELVSMQYREGLTDFNRVFVIQRRLTQQQTALVTAQAAVPAGLIFVFEALGGGWRTPLEDTPLEETPIPLVPPAPLSVPSPSPRTVAVPTEPTASEKTAGLTFISDASDSDHKTSEDASTAEFPGVEFSETQEPTPRTAPGRCSLPEAEAPLAPNSVSKVTQDSRPPLRQKPAQLTLREPADNQSPDALVEAILADSLATPEAQPQCPSTPRAP